MSLNPFKKQTAELCMSGEKNTGIVGDNNMVGIVKIDVVNIIYQCVEKSKKFSDSNIKLDIESGHIDDVDILENFEKLKLLANQNNENAMYDLGEMYRMGRVSTTSNDEEIRYAMMWHKKAVKSGHILAHAQLGAMLHQHTQEYKEAFRLTKIAAEHGIIMAKCNIAEMLKYGKGTEKNSGEAERYFKGFIQDIHKFAEQDSISYQLALGHCYAKGNGVSKNYKKSAYWYYRAAQQGNVEAQYFLANCYYSGKGVEKNIDKFLEWIRKSAEQKHPCSLFLLGSAYYNGLYGLEKNFQQAIEYLFPVTQEIKGWTKNNDTDERCATAQTALGLIYNYGGHDIERDFEKAFHWLKKGADSGNKVAQHNIGFLYEEGFDKQKVDFESALYWYEKAAEQGLAESQYNLGRMYYEGMGVEKPDSKKSLEWVEKAAKQDNIDAQYTAGFLYYYGGIGVEKDFKKALYWLRRATENGHSDAKDQLLLLKGELGISS